MGSSHIGNEGQPAKYTAFGEPVSGPAHRFGYAGTWGYQSNTAGEFTQLHVGHRWYDPSLGRFIQRDPMGLTGGSNVYIYARSRPLTTIDPSGLEPCPTCGHDPDAGDKGNLDIGGKIGISKGIPYGEISVSGKARDWEDAVNYLGCWFTVNFYLKYFPPKPVVPNPHLGDYPLPPGPGALG